MKKNFKSRTYKASQYKIRGLAYPVNYYYICIIRNNNKKRKQNMHTLAEEIREQKKFSINSSKKFGQNLIQFIMK